MSEMTARMLQPLVRRVAQNEWLQSRFWSCVVKARQHYARCRPALEIETTIEGDIRVRALLSDHIEAQLYWQGYQEADLGVLRLIRRHLPRDGVFVDIGANIGSFTLVAARLAGRGRVHAFEPSAHHFSRLSRNVGLNRFDNVVLNRAGLSDCEGEADLFLPCSSGVMNNSGAASLFSPQGNLNVERVDLLRFDDYVLKSGIDRIDLVKIDIEGAEHAALKGASEALARFRPIVLMELDLDNLRRAGCEPSRILEFWARLGYRVGRIEASGETVPVGSEADLRPHQNLMCRP